MSFDKISMSYSDLSEQQDLDAGAFGKVSLCHHRECGLVVLKKVYTGYKNPSEDEALLEEGKIMHRLKHDRVVKLLGIILETGNYSLVIEYMEKGNLLTVLKKVELPLSIKSRIVLEVIEGMTYLHREKVVHKDLKPENILVNDDFHIKIADLGLATLKAWSRLTKEESKRQMKSNNSSSRKAYNAGTLFYMAPEHLRSIHEKACEKSDVYSFGIVMWVIFANKEPYEDAMNDEQVVFCVSRSERPQISDLPSNCPEQAKQLMQTCWDDEPSKRPTFKECDCLFREYYTNNQEQYVEDDVSRIKPLYPKPPPAIQRMQSLLSLQTDCDAEPPSIQPTDQPQSLHSSQGLHTGNSINESLFEPVPNDPIDSEVLQEEMLSRKLQTEMNYHQTGSFIDLSMRNAYSQPQFQNSGTRDRQEVYGEPVNHPPLPGNPGPSAGFSARTPETPSNGSPAYIPEAQMANLQMFGSVTPQSRLIPSLHNMFGQRGIVYPFSLPAASQNPQRNSKKLSVPESTKTNNSDIPQHQYGHPSDVNHVVESFPNLNISNAKAVQIGNNNFMSISSSARTRTPPCDATDHGDGALFNQLQLLDPAKLITEEQLQFLRENLAKKWKPFARKLGFREPEIEQIDHDFERDGLEEKVHQTLYKWKMKEGSRNATVLKVANALYNMNESDLLDKLLNYSQ